ncbi:MAG: glycosyltransferase [Candidatus Sericytochromatia bacterium]
MTRARLSLCLLVKDAVTLLRDCLESVRPVVDDWVIGDTGSEDGTLRLLAELLPDVRIHHLPWHQDFSLARNQLLELASGDWVLMLDADERLAPESLPVLRQQTAAFPTGPLGIRGVFLDLQAGGRLVRRWHKICLLSRHPGLYYQGRVHEQPLLQGGELPVLTEPALVFQHWLPEPERWQAKQARYAALLAGESHQQAPLQRYHLAHHRLFSGQATPEETLQTLEALCEETLRGREHPPAHGVGIPLGEAITNLLRLSAENAPPEVTLARGVRWAPYANESEALQILARVSESCQAFQEAERYWFESLNPALNQRHAQSAWEPLLGLARLAQRQGAPLLAAAWRWQAVAQGGLLSDAEIPVAQLPPLERVVGPLIQAQQQAAAERQHDMVLVWSALLLPLHPQLQTFRLAVTAAVRLGAVGLAAVLGRLGALLWPQDRLLANSALQEWDEVHALRPTDWRLLALCCSQPTTLLRQASGPDWLQALQGPRSGGPGWLAAGENVLFSETERLALIEWLSYAPFYPGPLLLETEGGTLQLTPATLARSAPPLSVSWRP